MNIEEKLQELGYELPKVAAAAANYIPYMVTGNYLFISGQIPFLNGETMHTGTVGQSVSLEEGVEAARACALNILGQVNAAVDGDWSKVKRCVKLGGFVSCGPDFHEQHKVVNGASDLIGDVMGEAGKHTRFAVGAPSLPLNAAVEIDAVFELND